MMATSSTSALAPLLSTSLEREPPAWAPPSPSAPATPTADTRPTVLHFIYSISGGGAETMMRNLVRGLDRTQWRVVVVAMQAKAWPAAERELRQACDHLHVLDETALTAPRTLSKLNRILCAERPAVVQTWMHHADFVGGLVARWVGIRHIVWGIHCREITRSPDESPLKHRLLRWLLPLAARWLPSRIVSCSQVALEDHAKLGFPRSKMHWISNGIDTERFRPDPAARQRSREALGFTAETPLLGFVGRFHEMKNLPLLLQAFALLQARLPAAHLLLCGVEAPDLDAECRALAAALPHPRQLHFRSFQTDPEKLYPALDLFTLSSRTEACPMTILEAMACGVPCVTTQVGDCAALIGSTGLTVPTDDPATLCQAWSQLLTEAEPARTQRRLAARASACSHFTIARTVAAYSQLYAQLAPHSTA
jgi:glycosyltransferase involved in cell wall biosynthesis